MKQQSKNPHNKPIFQKINYYLMMLGGVLFLLGILLMIGGGSDNPDVFDKNDIYSFRRITIAPLLIIIGFIVEVIAILYRQKDDVSA